MSNRCRIYARVSTDKQKQDGTMSNQVSASVLRDIKRMNLDMTGVYDDEGKSASTGKLHLRGGFLQAIADAEAHEYDVLWVCDLDRITRSNDWGELGRIFGPLQKAGIKLAGPGLAPMHLGDSHAMVHIIMRVTLAYESNERRKLGFADGKREAALRGAHVQGTIPYGLRYVANKLRNGEGWSIHEEHAILVRDMYKRAIAGESGDSIAKDLERHLIPGPGANKQRPMGGRWDQAVIRILRSTVYRGVHRWNDVLIPVPRIVDDVTWYAAQAALGEAQTRGIGQPIGLYLCYQLAVCALCGATMYMHHGEGVGGKLVRQYKCLNRSHRRRAGTKQCTLPVFNQAAMDELIWAEVAGFLSQPVDVILTILRGKFAEENREAKAWSSDVERLGAQLVAMNKQEAEMLVLWKGGFLDDDNVKADVIDNAARKARLLEQLRVAQGALETTGSTLTAALALEAMVGHLRTVARKADERQRRDLVRLLVCRGGIMFDQFGVNVRLAFAAPEPGKKSTQGFEATHAVTLRVVA